MKTIRRWKMTFEQIQAKARYVVNDYFFNEMLTLCHSGMYQADGKGSRERAGNYWHIPTARIEDVLEHGDLTPVVKNWNRWLDLIYTPLEKRDHGDKTRLIKLVTQFLLQEQELTEAEASEILVKYFN